MHTTGIVQTDGRPSLQYQNEHYFVKTQGRSLSDCASNRIEVPCVSTKSTKTTTKTQKIMTRYYTFSERFMTPLTSWQFTRPTATQTNLNRHRKPIPNI